MGGETSVWVSYMLLSHPLLVFPVPAEAANRTPSSFHGIIAFSVIAVVRKLFPPLRSNDTGTAGIQVLNMNQSSAESAIELAKSVRVSQTPCGPVH